jgi:predicted component of type VI protein secretion system
MSTEAAPGPRTGSELAQRLAAERAGSPFLLYRGDHDEQLIVALDAGRGRLTLGRDRANDVALGWDHQVSRVHAELERVGADWTISDDGLSRNGTFVNGGRLGGRRRLRDGDCLRLGRTVIVFAAPDRRSDTATMVSGPAFAADELTPMQRRILSALCRPLVEAGGIAAPASNREIADAVHLSVEGVKGQLRTLADRFGVGELPQNQKRLELAERAFRAGLGPPARG